MLTVEGLVVKRGGSTIIRGVSLQVAAGQIVALLGPSGAGKSTFFSAVVGDLPSAQGRVMLGSNDVSNLPLWLRVRHGIGYLPQGPSVLFDLSVYQNLVTFFRLADVQSDVLAYARSWQLHTHLNVRARDLSGGERRRLELARTLLRQPSVVVCDEPFAGVDPSGVSLLAQQLRHYADNGGSLLLSDHHAFEALQIADRAHLLIDGNITVTSHPSEFLKHPEVTERYVGK